MRRWTILNGLLGLIVLLLGLQIARTWARALPPVDLSARPLEAAPPRAEGGGGREGRGRKRGGTDKQQPPTPEAMVTAIASRDLLDPSRQKPTEEVPAAVAKEPQPPPNVTVVGVRILGKDREAFVTDASQGPQQKRLRIGDRLGDYTIKAIDPQRVTLASPQGELVKLALSVDKSGQPAAKPGMPLRPGQPAGQPAPSPAAGLQPTPPVQPQPVAGVPPRPPRPPAGPGAAARGPNAVVTTTTMPHAPGVPSLPAGVREKLEQLRTQ